MTDDGGSFQYPSRSLILGRLIYSVSQGAIDSSATVNRAEPDGVPSQKGSDPPT